MSVDHLTILQLTDLHLFADGAPLRGVPTWQTLDEILRAARETGIDFARVIITGDLAHDEIRPTYERLRETLGDWAERVRAVLSRAAKRLELARNLVKRRLNEREAELQLRSGLSEIDRAVAKLQSVARARFKFKRLVPS